MQEYNKHGIVMNSTLEIAKKLISFPSVTPNDAGALDYIKELLESAGFVVIIKQFGEVRNLYAERGEGGQNLCFAGHIDVVDPIDKSLWNSDPFEPCEKDGFLYGRGATDMKTAVAAGLDAAMSFVKQNKDHKQKISFLITSDEEVGSPDGTLGMLKWLYAEGYKIDFAIIGEPTCEKEIGDIIKIGRRGSVNFKLQIHGVAGHAAYHEQAVNPVKIAAKVVNALYELKLDSGNANFDPSNLEVTNIYVGNESTNVIPANTDIYFNIRFNNEYKGKELHDIIYNKIISIHSKIDLHTHYSAESFLVQKTSFHHDFASIVEKNCGVRSRFATNGGTSDARFIKDYCNLLEFGVVNTSAHKINEFVKISDLQTLKNVYYDAISRFCI
jgi:succinyl-diaminopimelate desuccinylase